MTTAETIKIDDTFTIDAPFFARNPDRRWWQFWKPRWVQKRSPVFVVTACDGGGVHASRCGATERGATNDWRLVMGFGVGGYAPSFDRDKLYRFKRGDYEYPEPFKLSDTSPHFNVAGLMYAEVERG